MKFYFILTCIIILLGFSMGLVMQAFSGGTQLEHEFTELDGLKPNEPRSNTSQYMCYPPDQIYNMYEYGCSINNYSLFITSVSVYYDTDNIISVAYTLRGIQLAHIVNIYGQPTRINRNTNFTAVACWSNFAIAYIRHRGIITLRSTVNYLILRDSPAFCEA